MTFTKDSLREKLVIPAIAAPMFLVSGPDLVVETCRTGIMGTFPALNQRSSEGYAAWLDSEEQRAKALPEHLRSEGLDAVTEARGGRLVAHPLGFLLERLQITLFADPHVYVEAVGASQTAGSGEGPGYRLTIRARLR